MMKSFSIFTIGALLVCAGVFALKEPLIAQVTGQAKTPAAKKKTPEKKKLTPEEAKAAQQKAAAEEARLARDRRYARDLLLSSREAHRRLKSFRATIRQSTTIGERSFSASGSYVAGPENKMRLELEMTLDSGLLVTKAKLLQVCNGTVLKTLRVVGKRQRMTRRNVQQILNVAASRGRDVHNSLVTELGLGGVNAMLASLFNTMVFDTYKDDRSGKQPIHIIEGSWNPTFRNHLSGLSANRQGIPEFVPDRVRVYIDRGFILRAIEYLKRDAESKTYSPMITLKFENIKLNPRTDDKEFEFDGTGDVYSEEDVTEIYLRQLVPKAKQ